MSRLEERVSSIEEIMKELAIEQLRAQRSISRLSKEMREFKDEMKEFKDEMKAFKDEMKEFKDEMRTTVDSLSKEMKAFKDEMKEFKDEMKEFKDKMDRNIEEMNKKWGDVANSLGIVVEAIIAPGLPGLLKKAFGCEKFDRLMVDIEVRKPGEKDKIREFDVIVLCGDFVFLNETKSKMRKEYIEEFKSFLDSGEFFEYFPELKGKTLIPIMSSLQLKPHFIAQLTRNKIFAVTLDKSELKVENLKKVKKHYPQLTKLSEK